MTGLLEHDYHTTTPDTLGVPVYVYKNGQIKALSIAGPNTMDWVADTKYNITTIGGIYAPTYSWSKRIVYKYVSGSPQYALLAMDTGGVISITPETVSYGGTMWIYETYL